MTGSSFAATPEPPYYAVIFSSLRQGPDAGYGETADRMMELAAQQPGYLGVESLRGPDGFGITVSYWRDEESIRAWKRDAEHAEARRRGRTAAEDLALEPPPPLVAPPPLTSTYRTAPDSMRSDAAASRGLSLRLPVFSTRQKRFRKA